MAVARARASAADVLDDFELEVRKLPGVVGVGFSGERGDLTVHISFGDAADALAAKPQLPDLLRLYFEQPVACLVDVAGGASGAIGELFVVPEDAAAENHVQRSEPEPNAVQAGPARRAGDALRRVEVLGVKLVDEGEHVEVQLRMGAQQKSARAAGARPKAAAEATIEALRSLGWKTPFNVKSAIRLAVGAEGAVIVYLDGPGAERMGISRARTTEEAAVKATLHALNRYLDDPRHQTV